MCGRGPGGACGHAAPALDAACAEVVVFEALHVIDGGPGGGGTRGHDRWSLWPVGGGRNFLVLQHVCFLGKFSGGRECAEVLVQAAGHLCMWRRCRERLVWWVVCPALVGVVPEVVCCRLGGRRVPT